MLTGVSTSTDMAELLGPRVLHCTLVCESQRKADTWLGSSTSGPLGGRIAKATHRDQTATTTSHDYQDPPEGLRKHPMPLRPLPDEARTEACPAAEVQSCSQQQVKSHLGWQRPPWQPPMQGQRTAVMLGGDGDSGRGTQPVGRVAQLVAQMDIPAAARGQACARGRISQPNRLPVPRNLRP